MPLTKSIVLHGKQAKKVGEFSLSSKAGRNTAKKRQNLCQTAEQNATKESISLKENKYCTVKNKNHGRKFKLRRKV